MQKQKFLGIILMLVFAVALNGCNQGGNKSRPGPTRPKSHINQPGNKSSKQEKSKNESQGKQGNKSGKSSSGNTGNSQKSK